MYSALTRETDTRAELAELSQQLSGLRTQTSQQDLDLPRAAAPGRPQAWSRTAPSARQPPARARRLAPRASSKRPTSLRATTAFHAPAPPATPAARQAPHDVFEGPLPLMKLVCNHPHLNLGLGIPEVSAQGFCEVDGRRSWRQHRLTPVGCPRFFVSQVVSSGLCPGTCVVPSRSVSSDLDTLTLLLELHIRLRERRQWDSDSSVRARRTFLDHRPVQSHVIAVQGQYLQQYSLSSAV
ncbi:hypothetical protein Taro_045651 [Colocasia esculenta]|uniref:Uncharacterized protein n=1 Tax=Colocasia esculenta TaxID=4460 RepID=A0A843X332_COLES|nr:hypothetical protein [Colocasia esculenta]